MRRGLFTFAASGSLALCGVTVLLWVRSYFVEDTYSKFDGLWSSSVISTRGKLDWYSVTRPVRPGYAAFAARDVIVRVPYPDEPGVRHHARFLGMFWYVTDGGRIFRKEGSPKPYGPLGFLPSREICVPYWMVALAFSILPAVWLRAAGRRRRRDVLEGRLPCPRCQYDLTGNTSGVCPECGRAVSN